MRPPVPAATPCHRSLSKDFQGALVIGETITAVTFTAAATARTLERMRQSAAVLCHDHRSLETLGNTLEELGMGLTNCHSQRQALESVMNGQCSTLIVDFDLPGAVTGSIGLGALVYGLSNAATRL